MKKNKNIFLFGILLSLIWVGCGDKAASVKETQSGLFHRTNGWQLHYVFQDSDTLLKPSKVAKGGFQVKRDTVWKDTTIRNRIVSHPFGTITRFNDFSNPNKNYQGYYWKWSDDTATKLVFYTFKSGVISDSVAFDVEVLNPEQFIIKNTSQDTSNKAIYKQIFIPIR